MNVEYFKKIGERMDNLFDFLPKEQIEKYENWYRDEFRAKHIYIDEININRLSKITLENLRCFNRCDVSINHKEMRGFINTYILELLGGTKRQLIEEIHDTVDIMSQELCRNCICCSEYNNCKLRDVRDGIRNLMGVECMPIDIFEILKESE